MRAIGTALAFCMLTLPAAANCGFGSADPITVDDWSVEVLNDSTHRISYTLTSHLDKPVRMVEVVTGFFDVLGNAIGAFQFEPDFSIAPDETVPYSREIGSLLMPRLPNIAKEDAVPYFCTLSVVYADGEIEEFGQQW